MLDQLTSIVGEGGVLVDREDTAPYLTDLLKLYRGKALAVVRPRAASEVARVVRLCADNGFAVTPYGGGTGFCGGAVPAGERPHVVVSLERMRRIRLVDPVNDAIIAEAGCPLAEIQRAAAEAGRLFPVSHGGEGTSQVGGMVATNSGGNNVVRYGMTRAQVLGLEVVLADGSIWDGLRLLRKDNAGYDLKQLFIGSEGTLGIITAAALALRPRPLTRATALAAVAGPQAALDLYIHLRGHAGELISAIELIPRSGIDLHFARMDAVPEPFERRHGWMVLIELETVIPGLSLDPLLEGALGAAWDAGLVSDVVVAQSDAQRAVLWALREGLAVAQASSIRVLKSDTSVPLGAMAEFVELAARAVEAILPGAVPIPFGHIGDGNIHFNVLAPEGMDDGEFARLVPELSETIQTVALALGGSISAEHGLGQSKRDSAAKTRPDELALMRRIKSALDPDNRFNPDKIIALDKSRSGSKKQG